MWECVWHRLEPLGATMVLLRRRDDWESERGRIASDRAPRRRARRQPAPVVPERAATRTLPPTPAPVQK